MRKILCFFFVVFSYGASQQRPCVRIGLTHAYLSHVKMTLANAKSVNRQTLENVVRNAASEFTQRTAIASLASLSTWPQAKNANNMKAQGPVDSGVSTGASQSGLALHFFLFGTFLISGIFPFGDLPGSTYKEHSRKGSRHDQDLSR